jgi:iron-sulfur cluster repair protein YtfE (RIC family)
MIKYIGNNGSKRHVIHFEEWPIDCLVRYLEKNKQLLLNKMAPKIMDGISSLSSNKSHRLGWIRQLDDLFTSCVNRLVIQITREDQNLLPYLNQLIVTTERKIPMRMGTFSVMYDCIASIKQDHVAQKKIFELIHTTVYDFSSDAQTVYYPHLFSAVQTFEMELFHILDLQSQVLFPKICRMVSVS